MTADSDLAPILPALLEALGANGIPVVVFAAEGGAIRRLYANEPMAALLGYSLEAYEATGELDTVAPDHRPLVLQLLTSFRSGQPLPPVMEVNLLHRDGTVLAVEASAARLPCETGDWYATVLRAVHAPLQTQLSLLEADRITLVAALSAGFAHEINNPLTSVLLNLRTLRKHVGGTAAMRCVDDIAIAAERIANNVRALQTLAARSAPGPIELAAVVASALRLAAPTLQTVAIVERKLEEVRIVGEESRVGQAVLAMLLFSCSGFEAVVGVPTNRIWVDVGTRGTAVYVEVTDNGRDLTADEARHAFEPFFRSSARGAGVGVGLGVARAVATALGGAVTLTGRADGGAVITMTLPAAPAG